MYAIVLTKPHGSIFYYYDPEAKGFVSSDEVKEPIKCNPSFLEEARLIRNGLDKIKQGRVDLVALDKLYE